MEALSYRFAGYEGPLDLLLTLIAKNKLNILDINVSDLLAQYMEQIRIMQENRMEIASEFLEMASRLVYMKSVSLLPKNDEAEQLRQELTGELLEYQLCKEMAYKLSLQTRGFDTFVRAQMVVPIQKEYRRKHEAQELVDAYFSAVGRGQRKLPPPMDSFSPIVARAVVSVSSKVIHILRGLRTKSRIRLRTLYESAQSRSELVATFLAVLELVKAKRIHVSGESDKATLTVYAKGESAQ